MAVIKVDKPQYFMTIYLFFTDSGLQDVVLGIKVALAALNF